MKTSSKLFNERLRTLLSKRGAVALLSREIEVSPSAIKEWINGNSEPKLENLVALSNHLDVNIQWLSTGTGPKASGDSTSEDVADRDLVKVPRYNAQLSAGSGAFNERADILDYIPFTLDFFKRKLGRATVDGLAIVDVAGDSMMPTINHHDIVLVDLNRRSLTDGIMAFIWDESSYIKRLQKNINGIEIISDNPQYKTQLVTKDETEQLYVIGQVIWCGHIF